MLSITTFYAIIPPQVKGGILNVKCTTKVCKCGVEEP